jgi:predicted nuclease of predicted toxin-antitoxin system
MKIVLDENVSADVGVILRSRGHQVILISEMATPGIADRDVWNLILGDEAILITRDYHFTNPVKFDVRETAGVIYLRRGNLTAEMEVHLLERFFSTHKPEEFRGRLVSLSLNSTRIR